MIKIKHAFPEVKKSQPFFLNSYFYVNNYLSEFMAVFCSIHPTVQKYDYTGNLKFTKMTVIQVLN